MGTWVYPYILITLSHFGPQPLFAFAGAFGCSWRLVGPGPHGPPLRRRLGRPMQAHFVWAPVGFSQGSARSRGPARRVWGPGPGSAWPLGPGLPVSGPRAAGPRSSPGPPGSRAPPGPRARGPPGPRPPGFRASGPPGLRSPGRRAPGRRAPGPGPPGLRAGLGASGPPVAPGPFGPPGPLGLRTPWALCPPGLRAPRSLGPPSRHVPAAMAALAVACPRTYGSSSSRT